MRFSIRHHTEYRYSSPVRLGPQQLRFHPRDDGAQRTIAHRLDIFPSPVGRNDHIDLQGNRVTQLWFDGETDRFEVDVEMDVETLRRNAYDFILAPEARGLPILHEDDALHVVPLLERPEPDDTVNAFADEIGRAADGDPLRFLDELSRSMHAAFAHVLRETGVPQSPAFTLASKRGACRDLTVLFVDVCRAQGIAARFASGYQRGDLTAPRRHLHAWPEVYLPGAGWRGYDPTHGEANADTHVTIAAAAHPRDTMPIIGGFTGAGATSTLGYTVEIAVAEE